MTVAVSACTPVAMHVPMIIYMACLPVMVMADFEVDILPASSFILNKFDSYGNYKTTNDEVNGNERVTGDEWSGMQKPPNGRLLQTLVDELKKIPLNLRQRVAHLLYVHFLVVPGAMADDERTNIVAHLSSVQNEAVSTEVNEEMATSLMVDILGKLTKCKTVDATQDNEDTQCSTMAEPGSQRSAPSSSVEAPGEAKTHNKKRKMVARPNHKVAEGGNWLAERIMKYITTTMNRLPQESRRNFLEIISQVVNRHCQMSACLTRSLGDVCLQMERDFSCCGEPSSCHTAMSSKAAPGNVRLADSMVERVREILAKRLEGDRNTMEELRQRLHELAMWIVAIEGEDWDDTDDEETQPDEAAMMQRGGGGAPPWRSSWSMYGYQDPRSRSPRGRGRGSGGDGTLKMIPLEDVEPLHPALVLDGVAQEEAPAPSQRPEDPRHLTTVDLQIDPGGARHRAPRQGSLLHPPREWVRGLSKFAMSRTRRIASTPFAHGAGCLACAIGKVITPACL